RPPSVPTRRSSDLPLAVEGDVVTADQQRHDHVRPGFLNLVQRGTEVRDCQGDELLADHRAAVAPGVVAHPVGRDVAVVVVGGDGVNPGSVVPDGPGDQGAELLLGHDAGGEDILVTDAALVLLIVEVQHPVPIYERTYGFARGAGDPTHDDDRFVL